MLIRNESELDDLAHRFTECKLSKDEWTHIAHLAIGLWHIEHYGAEEALPKLREGIRRLNDAQGTLNSATSGYHETITQAYVRILSAFSDRYIGLPICDRLSSLLSSPLAEKNVLLTFYSRQRLMSVEARLGWVEPDLAQIEPQLGNGA